MNVEFIYTVLTQTDEAINLTKIQELIAAGAEGIILTLDMGTPTILAECAIALNCAAVLVVMSEREEDFFFTSLMKDYLPDGGSERELNLIHTLDHITEGFPPVFLMTAEEDLLKADAMALSKKLMEKNVPFVFRYYRSGEEKLGHVFHLNVRSRAAALCNDEECGFFRSMIQ